MSQPLLDEARSELARWEDMGIVEQMREDAGPWAYLVERLVEQKEADDKLAAWVISELYGGGSWRRMEGQCPEINAYVDRIGAFAEDVPNPTKTRP